MFLKNRLTILNKICLTGILTVLTIIFQRIVAFNDGGFIRISFGGPAIIIFSSILLGPIYGGFVGVFSDLLGYIVLDPKPFLFQITLLYAIFGIVPYFVFNIIRHMKNEKNIRIIEFFISILFAIGSGVLLFSKYGDNFEIWLKIIIMIWIILLPFLIQIFIRLFNKKIHKNPIISPLNLSFCTYVIEVICMILIGTLLKTWAFGNSTFMPILICQIIVGTINIPLNILFVSVFLNYTKKYFITEGVTK